MIKSHVAHVNIPKVFLKKITYIEEIINIFKYMLSSSLLVAKLLNNKE